MPSRCFEFVDSRLRRSPPDRASAVPMDKLGKRNAFPPPCPQVGGCPQASQQPQQRCDNFVSGNDQISSRPPAFSLFFPGSCPNNRDRRSADYLRNAAVSVLIYDVGLHDGRDTGHYLREGCRVVAIDANPAMCAAAEVQFRNYIRSGQLKIINRGIAECKDQLKFWVCDDVSEWSSFHREIASRNGARHHSILVDC